MSEGGGGREVSRWVITVRDYDAENPPPGSLLFLFSFSFSSLFLSFSLFLSLLFSLFLSSLSLLSLFLKEEEKSPNGLLL